MYQMHRPRRTNNKDKYRYDKKLRKLLGYTGIENIDNFNLILPLDVMDIDRIKYNSIVNPNINEKSGTNLDMLRETMSELNENFSKYSYYLIENYIGLQTDKNICPSEYDAPLIYIYNLNGSITYINTIEDLDIGFNNLKHQISNTVKQTISDYLQQSKYSALNESVISKKSKEIYDNIFKGMGKYMYDITKKRIVKEHYDIIKTNFKNCSADSLFVLEINERNMYLKKDYREHINRCVNYFINYDRFVLELSKNKMDEYTNSINTIIDKSFVGASGHSVKLIINKSTKEVLISDAAGRRDTSGYYEHMKAMIDDITEDEYKLIIPDETCINIQGITGDRMCTIWSLLLIHLWLINNKKSMYEISKYLSEIVKMGRQGRQAITKIIYAYSYYIYNLFSKKWKILKNIKKWKILKNIKEKYKSKLTYNAPRNNNGAATGGRRRLTRNKKNKLKDWNK